MHTEPPTLLAACLRAPAQPDATATETVAQWWPHWLALRAHAADPVALAIGAGWSADRVGWAFAGGYQAALRALVPGQLAHDTLAAFCVTEATGNRPRDIHTTLTPQADGRWRLTGHKRWTTLGPAGQELWVVGALPERASAGRPALCVARVPVPATGLTLQPMPATRFVPEVPHAEVRLDQVCVAADALLPGDGYARYVKPFRTREDQHVTVAVLAYLLRTARARNWPAAFAEELVATLTLLTHLARAAGPDNDGTPTLALAGALHQAHRLYTQAGTLWAAAGPDDPAAQRWERDAALFAVAGTARALRAQRGWERLAAGA